MNFRIHPFLSGVFVMLGFAALTANVKAQTMLDRDTGAVNSDRPYLQLAGLEGPSLHPLQRVGHACQVDCPMQTNSAEANEQGAAARAGKGGAGAAPGGKSQVSCAPPR